MSRLLEAHTFVNNADGCSSSEFGPIFGLAQPLQIFAQEVVVCGAYKRGNGCYFESKLKFNFSMLQINQNRSLPESVQPLKQAATYKNKRSNPIDKDETILTLHDCLKMNNFEKK